MPKELDDFPDSSRSHRNAKYPWDDWLDGEVRKFVQGEDYECKTESFRNCAWQAASTRGGKIKSHYPDGRDGGSVILQFVEEDTDA